MSGFAKISNKNDTILEDKIICPYCGYIFSDSWEYNPGEYENVECMNCDEIFVLNVVVTVEYSTQKGE